MNSKATDIRVPAGTYCTGLSFSEAGGIYRKSGSTGIKPEYLQNSCPPREVEIDEMDISAKLVTLAEFREFVSETGFRTDAEQEGWGWTWDGAWMKRDGLTWEFPFGNSLDARYREKEELLPVLQVSCNDAGEYCAWLSKKTGTRIRLPREEEWEIFAGIFPDEVRGISPGERFADINAYYKVLEETAGEHAPRCPRGLVWEWTGSWFTGYSPEVENREFGTTYKVLRGGSLMSDPVQKIREYRYRRCPTARSPFYGFRTARVL